MSVRNCLSIARHLELKVVVIMKNVVLIPESVSALKPNEFNKLGKSQTARIESVRIESPVLGRKGFGRIIVKWKTPRLRPAPIRAK
jgi:hypothetical protein